MEKKTGKFYASTHMVEQGEIAEVLAKMEFVPLNVRYDKLLDGYEYIGISPMFELSDEGVVAPEYTIKMTKTITDELDEFDKGCDLQVEVELVSNVTDED